MKDSNGRRYTVQNVHIDSVRPGDTVRVAGELRTVCRNNLRVGGFMGTTLFGDSYNLGQVPVERVTFERPT